MSTHRRYDWSLILDRARSQLIEEQITVGIAPTLRRLHYLLVSDRAATEAGYQNTTACYKQLSEHTTRARDAGTFPDLSDRTRSISYADGETTMPDVSKRVRRLAERFTLRRDLALPVQVVLIAEKDGVMPLLDTRFDWLTRSAVRGYSSVTHARRLADLADHDRNTVGLYFGDYDPSGLDITRALGERLPYPVQRVALTWAQVQAHDLPPAPAKTTDTRLASMQRDEGRTVQVELDALAPHILLDLVGEAISDVSGVALDRNGWPDLPELDEEEARIRRELGLRADYLDTFKSSP